MYLLQVIGINRQNLHELRERNAFFNFISWDEYVCKSVFFAVKTWNWLLYHYQVPNPAFSQLLSTKYNMLINWSSCFKQAKLAVEDA
jgi:hypothetical protein